MNTIRSWAIGLGLLLSMAALSSAQTYTITDLGTLGGPTSSASSLNSSGQVVGWAELSASLYYHASVWSGGQIQDLGVLGVSDSIANGINDSGQIVGYSDDVSGAVHGFLWTQSGGMQDVNGSAYSSLVNAINASGQMVGAKAATRDSKLALDFVDEWHER